MNIVITGGVGFIGTNTALMMAKLGHSVVVVDNFSREGVDYNAGYLQQKIPQLVTIKADVRDLDAYKAYIKKADAVIHLAGQTAVTASIQDPMDDYSNNLEAGIGLLELLRKKNPKAVCIFSSTNKVYGELGQRTFVKNEALQRYEDVLLGEGIAEDEPLSFVSPYGCSKGSLDQYFLDYARSYQMRTMVFRQSCIYGPFQQGVEDQGWVAHFSKQALLGKPITIFGDGYQVRDLLFVEDLVEAYSRAIVADESLYGNAFNIGGGAENAHSLLDVLALLADELGRSVPMDFADERLGDQKVFISDNSKVAEYLSWKPTTSFRGGLKKLVSWQRDFLDL